MPSRIDCGRISSAASVHLQTCDGRGAMPSAGITRANDRSVDADEDLVEYEPEQADDRLDERVTEQQLRSRAESRDEPGAERHAAHEDRQHECLRVRRVAQEQLQVVRPDRLVDEAGEAGYDENAEQKLPAERGLWLRGHTGINERSVARYAT